MKYQTTQAAAQAAIKVCPGQAQNFQNEVETFDNGNEAFLKDLQTVAASSGYY